MSLAPELLGSENEKERVVSDRRRRPGMRTTPSREASGQHLDHEGQAETLVGLIAPHGQDAAGRVPVKLIGIGGRISGRVENPAQWNTLPGNALDAHLSLRRGAGSEIQNERS